ncbi:MAG: hypothetical protein WD576_03295 [Nitriliruptoraceae bacterium]
MCDRLRIGDDQRSQVELARAEPHEEFNLAELTGATAKHQIFNKR